MHPALALDADLRDSVAGAASRAFRMASVMTTTTTTTTTSPLGGVGSGVD